MALPMNATPIYSLQIPSTKQEFKYRPFLVKEEKALLIAQHSENPNVQIETLKEVIRACAKTPIDVDSLASFDIEYIFVNLRARSVGELVELVFRCDTCEDEKAVASVVVDLTKMAVETNPDHTSKIPLFGDVGVVMKYPSFETLRDLENTSTEFDATFDIVASCIDYIYDSEEVFPIKEQKKEEVVEFLNNLTGEQFQKIQNFFKTMPQLRVQVDYTCPVCNKEHHKYMEGLSSFF